MTDDFGLSALTKRYYLISQNHAPMLLGRWIWPVTVHSRQQEGLELQQQEEGRAQAVSGLSALQATCMETNLFAS